MKKRTAICLLGLLLFATPVIGCGKEKDTQEDVGADVQAFMEDAEYGEVSAVNEDTITVKTGTLNNDEDTSSMLELTGEETELEISDDTSIRRMNFRGMQGGERPEGTPPAGMNEEIGIEDISVGDVISYICNDDGTVAEISLFSTEGR